MKKWSKNDVTESPICNGYVLERVNRSYTCHCVV